MKLIRKANDFKQVSNLQELVDQAQKDYDATPAGMRELKRRIRDYSGNQKESYKTRLSLAEGLRKAQLAELKTVDSGDIKHSSKNESEIAYQKNPNLDPIDDSSSEINNLISDSSRWIHKLNPDEIEAVSWLTSNGAGSINSYLAGSESKSPFHYSEAQLKKAVKNLDSAFSKWERKAPVTVYRGINSDIIGKSIWGQDGELDANLNKWVETNYPVGSTVETTTFMSTSLDPQKANGFGIGVLLEIESKKAASVVNVSAWSTTERELIIPRNQKYKVASVSKTKIASKSGTSHPVTIVKLIEE